MTASDNIGRFINQKLKKIKGGNKKEAKMLEDFFQVLFVTQTQSILISIAVVIVVAAVLAYISKLLKQDLIIAYIATGILLGPLVFGLIKDKALIDGFAQIGISFLLFVVGLEMSVKKLKEIARPSVVTGLIQVIATAAISAFVLVGFGFGMAEAVWVGIAIAFSSTIVVLKILADRNELDTLHGKIVIGIMLVQDILAIVALSVLTRGSGFDIAINLLKLGLLFCLCFLASFPTKVIVKKASSSGELLFLISLAFLFLFSSLAYILKLSIAIGSFMAGIVLANTPYKLDIEAKVRPLKDFFAIMFFVMIGMWLTSISRSVLVLLLPMLLVLIFAEPLITAFVLRMQGYKGKQSLDIGFAFAQLSEFTLILALYALSLNIISQKAFDLLVLMAVISIAITPYTMKLSRIFYKPFKIFDKIKVPLLKEPGKIYAGKKTVLLIGCHRMGSIFVRKLENIKQKLLVIDFNPEIVKALERKGISAVYGDANDIELFKLLPLDSIEIVISTIPKKETNILLLNYFKQICPRAFVAVVANRIDDALELYQNNADFVILPLIIGAERSIEMIKKLTRAQFKKLRKEQIERLKELHRILY
jgi:Kef-type K+ transport system membrane component KefB